MPNLCPVLIPKQVAVARHIGYSISPFWLILVKSKITHTHYMWPGAYISEIYSTIHTSLYRNYCIPSLGHGRKYFEVQTTCKACYEKIGPFLLLIFFSAQHASLQNISFKIFVWKYCLIYSLHNYFIRTQLVTLQFVLGVFTAPS